MDAPLPDFLETAERIAPAADTEERLAALCKALGHPVRVAIVKRLKEVDRCICGEIVDLFPLAQSTVSQHLKILKEAGLIRGEVVGPRICYCLDKEKFRLFQEMAGKL